MPEGERSAKSAIAIAMKVTYVTRAMAYSVLLNKKTKNSIDFVLQSCNVFVLLLLWTCSPCNPHTLLDRQSFTLCICFDFCLPKAVNSWNIPRRFAFLNYGIHWAYEYVCEFWNFHFRVGLWKNMSILAAGSWQTSWLLVFAIALWENLSTRLFF